MNRCSKWACALVVVFCSRLIYAQQAPLVESYLLEGRLADGEKALASKLQANPRDDQARYELGTLQFLQAVQHLSQSLHRYGALTGRWTEQLPYLRVANMAGPNPNPDAVTYADVRAIVQAFVDDLRRAEETLAAVKDPNVKMPLHIGLIRLDFDGDGKAGDGEYFWKLYQMLNRRAQVDQAAASVFVIGFDAADVLWLRGYCHLLMAMGEMTLAYDEQALFDTTAHVFFERPETPYAWTRERANWMEFGSGVSIADAIAFIHMSRFEVTEPRRMGEALKHLQEMVRLSREFWRIVQAETDDDNEWIPSPRQIGVIPGVKVTDEMVRAWLEFLDESDALLAGRKLVPFWRSNSGLGVNINRVFTQPRQFDLVLWVQGTAATPYLERGELTRSQSWDRWMRVFRGEFIGFCALVQLIQTVRKMPHRLACALPAARRN